MRFVVMGAALLILAVGVTMLLPRGKSLAVKRSELTIATVSRSPFEDYLPLRAGVEPSETVYLTAIEGGRVETVLARDGQHVDAGQPLATLSNPKLQLDVLSREAELASRLGDVSSQKLALQRAGSDLDQQIAATNYALLAARRELEKRQRLEATGIESPAAVRPFVDEVAYNLSRRSSLEKQRTHEEALAAAQRAQIEGTAARLRENLRLVHARLDALTLRAPVAGRLTNFDMQVGRSLSDAQGVGQVDSEDAYKLTADIDEFYLRRVSLGQTASATLDGRSYNVHVVRVLSQVTNGRFKAEFAFDGLSPPILKRGQTLDVRLVLGATRQSFVLPNSGWMEVSGGSFAFVVSPGGSGAQKRPITVGRRNPDQVEIINGLNPGDRVIVSSYQGLDTYDHLLLR